MRKRLITPTPETVRSRAEGWLDVERAAIVEITSEEKDFPVASIFASGETRGWRAAEPGPQTIRLVFDQPQKLKQLSLVFEEKKPRERKSSSGDGLRMAGIRFARLSVSSGTSALFRQHARSRNIKLSFQR
jgi:hypothetical protein